MIDPRGYNSATDYTIACQREREKQAIAETRALLKLAAKAAGLELLHQHADNDRDDSFVYYKPKGGVSVVAWNPLTDDGDALRLAAVLGMVVDFAYTDAGGNGWAVAVWLKDDSARFPRFWQATYPDVMRNARMTITRAAAHVGKDMP